MRRRSRKYLGRIETRHGWVEIEAVRHRGSAHRRRHHRRRSSGGFF